jgi:phosphatidylserine decarboxylase
MESMSSSISSSPYKISSKSTSQFKSSTHLNSLDVHHLGMAEAMRLKNWRHFNGSTCLPNFTKIHQSIQKLLAQDTDRQTETHTHTHRLVIW